MATRFSSAQLSNDTDALSFGPLPARTTSPLFRFLHCGMGGFFIPLAGHASNPVSAAGRCRDQQTGLQFVHHIKRPFVQRLGGERDRSFMSLPPVCASSVSATNHKAVSRCVTKSAQISTNREKS